MTAGVAPAPGQRAQISVDHDRRRPPARRFDDRPMRRVSACGVGRPESRITRFQVTADSRSPRTDLCASVSRVVLRGRALPPPGG
jgi:hypothetical protein